MGVLVAPFASRADWLNYRKSGIGASDSPIILNLSPHKKPYQLFKEKTGQAPLDDQSNPAIEMGNELEPIARDKFASWYNFEFNADEIFAPVNMEHEVLPWLRASLDGLSGDGTTLIEIKYQGQEAHESGIVKPHYYAQIQHQLFVSGAKLAYLVSINSYKQIKIIAIEPDRVFQNNLVAHCQAFWTDVGNGKMASENFDPEMVEAFRKWEQLGEEIKELEQERKALSDAIFASNVEHCGAYSVSTVERKGSVDYSKVKELDGVDLEPYRKESTVYKQIKKAKS